MKSALKVLFVMLFALTARAQDASVKAVNPPSSVIYPQTPESPKARFLFGFDGGYAFNNTTVGVVAGTEVPFGRHLEVDSFGYFYPYESKAVYGKGYLYNVKAGPLVWINQTSGVEGLFEKGGYTVTKVSKGADYVFAGYVYKHTMLGLPTRFHFDYFRQVLGKINPKTLVEPNDVTGGSFTFDTLMGCTKAFCVRSAFTWLTGRVVEQGNPYCDGTYSGCPNVIKRNTDVGGGFEWNVTFQLGGSKNANALF